jgi:hypothetical protein
MCTLVGWRAMPMTHNIRSSKKMLIVFILTGFSKFNVQCCSEDGAEISEEIQKLEKCIPPSTPKLL